VLQGAKEIAAFLGSKRVATVSNYRRKHPDFPVRVDDDGHLSADEGALRAWGIARGILKPETPDDLDLLKDDERPARPPQEIAPQLAAEPLGAFLDVAKFDAHPAPTGAVEDELREARALRHLFGRIVFSWKMETLASPKHIKAFKGFAEELARQINIIGRLEDSLVRQRMRNGQLLTEEGVEQLVNSIAGLVVEQFEGLGQALFDVVSAEVVALATKAGADITLDSDKVLKLFGSRFREARQRLSDGIVARVDAAAASQAERLGGEEEKAA